MKDDGDGGDNWSYDMQSSSQIATTDKSTPSSASILDFIGVKDDGDRGC